MKNIEFYDLIELRSALLSIFTNINYGLKEPEIIADLCKEIPDGLNGKIIAQRNISSGSVFVHQQPKVHCDGFKGKCVEIGDLLLIRSEYEKQNCRALLLQAKKTNNLFLTPDNHDQHLLYNEWPEFEYKKSTPSLNGKKRHIQDADVYLGTKYLLLPGNKKRLCNTFGFIPFCDYECYLRCKDIAEIKSEEERIYFRRLYSHYMGLFSAIPTKPDLTNYQCFINELACFILGFAGKSFSTPETGENGWNQVIQDLIDVTAKRPTNYFGKNQRGKEMLSFFTGGNDNGTNSFVDNGNSEDVPDDNEIRDGEGEGISVIVFRLEEPSRD